MMMRRISIYSKKKFSSFVIDFDGYLINKERLRYRHGKKFLNYFPSYRTGESGIVVRRKLLSESRIGVGYLYLREGL